MKDTIDRLFTEYGREWLEFLTLTILVWCKKAFMWIWEKQQMSFVMEAIANQLLWTDYNNH
jgi:hypothetical protein